MKTTVRQESPITPLSLAGIYTDLNLTEERHFDSFTKLAASICQAPVSILCLLDQHSISLKSSMGIPRHDIQQAYKSFSPAILKKDIFIIEDADKQKQLFSHPLLIAEMNIRFYAGIPLLSASGRQLGVLCVMDETPKHLSLGQLQSLELLAQQAVMHLELKADNQKLLEANEQLKQNSRSKDQFFSIIAHDLRAPFHGILGFSEVLAAEIDILDHKGISDIAQYIHNTSSATFRLLENLLHWAMAESGNMSYRPQIMNLRLCCQEVMHMLSSAAQNKNIMTQVNVPDSVTLYADPNMMMSVLLNLMSNALKFTHAGGYVNLIAEVQQDQVLIHVQDTGVGMSEEQIDKFFVTNQPKSVKGTDGERGTGLGMLLCKQFVEKNKGKIQIKSVMGEGTTFTVALPLLQ